MRLFSILLFLTIFSSELFAFKDAFYMGLSQGHTAGTSKNKEITKPRLAYDTTGEFSGIKLGTDMNLNRSHQIKGRWEFALENRSYIYERDGVETTTPGRRFNVAFLWGVNIDFMLNDELVPFVKIGYGVSTTDELGDAYQGVYGAGIYFTTKHFEIGAGIDKEGKKFGGVRLDEETLTDPQEENVVSYFNINIRLY